MHFAKPARRAVLVVAFLSATLPAQAPLDRTGTQLIYNGRSGQTQLRPPKVTGQIRVDGEMSEPAWSNAALLTGFTQYLPVDGVPAADSTEVRVMYSDDAIYFGVHAFESHGAVITSLTERDQIQSSDRIRLLLDTFDDRRRAFVFGATPLGVQGDGQFSDNSSGGSYDLNPDYLFESKGRLIEGGYTLEIRIPFKTLRYQQVDEQSWGLTVIRVVQHSGHEQSWAPIQRGAPSVLAQSGRLLGLRGLRRGLVLDVNPVVTQQTIGAPRAAANSAWDYSAHNPEFGGNVRWGATPNFTVNATVNPDFSQVESDVGQVVFDPRASLFFPEKRPFFLEGSENFEVPNTLIYTRSILAPVAAAKAAGKLGGMSLGVLTAVDDEVTSASGRENPLFTVARLRRDLGRQSNAGFVFTERREGDDWNRVVGADSRLYLGSYVLTGQLAGSFTRTAGETRSAPLFEMALGKSGRARGFSAVLEGVHPHFVAGAGFISRPGIAHTNVNARWSFFPRNGRIEAINFTPIFDGTWEWDRFTRGTEPNDIKLQTSTSVSWRGGWRTTLFTFAESFKYPAFLYTNYFIETRNAAGTAVDTVPYVGTNRLPNYGVDMSIATPQFQKLSASASMTAGHDDNFDEWSSAWIFFATLNADWRPTERVRVNLRYVEQRYHRVSDGSLVRLRIIPRAKLEYQLSRPIFLRVVTQYDASKVDELRDDSRTNFPILLRNSDGSFRRAIARERAGLRTDWLFSYQPNPGTVFFAGYGLSQGSPEFFRPSQLDRTADAFFVKASYLFRM